MNPRRSLPDAVNLCEPDCKRRYVFLGLLFCLACPLSSAGQEGRTKTRLLYSFEEAEDIADLKKSAENSDLIVVADNGVTHGKNCAAGW